MFIFVEKEHRNNAGFGVLQTPKKQTYFERRKRLLRQNLHQYEYLYRSLVTQFECGAYPEGKTMPSQQQLCRQYNVGITTIRRVMKMLENNGYIHTAAGRPAVSAYRTAAESCIAALLERRDGVNDAFCGLGILLPALYREGASLCREPEFTIMRDAIDGIAGPMELSALYQQANLFFRAVLKPFHNLLIQDLELDAESYLHVPYIPYPGVNDPSYHAESRVKAWLETALNRILRKEYDAFYDSILDFYGKTQSTIDGYLEELSRVVPTPAPQKTDIRWFRIKGHSELYIRLAMSILRRIAGGEFEGKKYLPSIPRLMEEYGLMKETVCRSIALLNMLGIAETKAKKGTILVTGEIQGSIASASFDFSDPLLQQRLALCMDAIQIMALSAGICAKSFTPVTEEWLHSAEEKLSSASLHSLNPRSVQLLMDYMIQFAPCHSLSNIYYQLNELILWGYYLYAVDASYYAPQEKLQFLMHDVVKALREKDTSALPSALENAFLQIYRDIYSVIAQLPCGTDFLPIPI